MSELKVIDDFDNLCSAIANAIGLLLADRSLSGKVDRTKTCFSEQMRDREIGTVYVHLKWRVVVIGEK